MTHAFFKALLFLGAGSVIHAMSDEQNIQKMGGLRRHLPLTHVTFLVAVLAIAGVPPLSGFFSKDEILWFALAGAPGAPIGGSVFLWGIGVITAALTAFYMMRLYLLVFSGDETRADEETKSHIHESPSLMTGPLVILAIGAIVVGFLGVPHFLGGEAIPNYFEEYLAPVFGHGAASAHDGAATDTAPLSEWAALVVTLIAAGAGLALGWRLYGRKPAAREEGAESGVTRLVRGKFFVDEAIDAVVLRPYKALCRFSSSFDTWVVDGLVNATGIGTDLAGEMARLLQTGYVRNYALAFFLGTVLILYFVLG
jgi:NADH-quinone oxidoreductase subunit L